MDDFDYFDDMKFNNSQDDDMGDILDERDLDLSDFGEDPIIDINNNAKQLDANEPSIFKKIANFVANTFVFVGSVIGSFVRAVIFGDSFQREMEISARNFEKAGKVKEKNKLNNIENKEKQEELDVEKNQEKNTDKNINNEINLTNAITNNINKVMNKICNEKFNIFRELGIDAEIKEDKYFKQNDNNELEIKKGVCVSTFDNLRNPVEKIVLDDKNSLNNIVNNAMLGILKHQPFVHNEILLSKNGNEFRPFIGQEAFVNAALKTTMLQAAIIVSSRKNMLSKSNYGDLVASAKIGEYTDKEGKLKDSELRVYASTKKNGKDEYENKITFRYKGRDIASINTEDLIGISNKDSGFLLSKVDEISKIMYQMMRKDDIDYIKRYCEEYNINVDDLNNLKNSCVEVVTDNIIQEKQKNNIENQKNNSENEYEAINKDDTISENIQPNECLDEGFINFSELAKAVQNELDEDAQINETEYKDNQINDIKDEQMLADDENIENISIMSDEVPNDLEDTEETNDIQADIEESEQDEMDYNLDI